MIKTILGVTYNTSYVTATLVYEWNNNAADLQRKSIAIYRDKSTDNLFLHYQTASKEALLPLSYRHAQHILRTYSRDVYARRALFCLFNIEELTT